MAVIMEKPHPALPTNHKPPGGIPYYVKSGDNWGSVAQAHGMGAASLIFFNFGTHEPKYVNYYLKHNVGCTTVSPDGKNYSFRGASPGIIYLPSAASHFAYIAEPVKPADDDIIILEDDDDIIILEDDFTNRLGEQIVKNYKRERDKTPDHLLCFEAAHARVKKATQQVCGVTVPELTEPPDTFTKLWGSRMTPVDEWLKLPAEFRGKGAAGAMAWAGRGKLVESVDIWAGKLKPGAVIQVWKDGKDFDRVKADLAPLNIGHSFIFLRYTKVGSAITGMKVADQGFLTGQRVRKGDWGFWVGANIFCGSKA